jgi:hypothetical protein
MRPDQRIRLQELSEKLIDVFLQETDPAEWPGAGKTHTSRTREERGDRAWVLKSVGSLASVVRHTSAIEGLDDALASGDEEAQRRQSDILDRRIQDAETRADAAVKRVIENAKR